MIIFSLVGFEGTNRRERSAKKSVEVVRRDRRARIRDCKKKAAKQGHKVYKRK